MRPAAALGAAGLAVAVAGPVAAAPSAASLRPVLHARVAPGQPAGVGTTAGRTAFVPSTPGATAAATPSAVPAADLDGDLVDRIERLVVFDADGALPELHLETLRAFARAMSPVSTLQAEVCAARDDAGGWRVRAGLARALARAGVSAWSIRAQPAGCVLPNSAVLGAGG